MKYLIPILLLGLFFRIYNLDIFYSWGHDQDLFAWIVKDIMVDHHIRLIGQETSITGVFIGPIFYYLIAIFMAIFNMDPLAANIPTTIISLLTIFSIYFIFKKFFGEKIGLIGAFLYAASPGIILLDRWVVPTQPTTLWCAWFLFCLLSILKGKIPIIILGVLFGLIWHVHVAFLPLLILVPISLRLSLKSGNKFKIKFKSILISVFVFLILMSPFLIFEVRHGFQQIKGFTRATYEEKGDVRGLDRVIKIFNISGRSLAGVFLLDKNPIFPKEFFMSLSPLLFILIFSLHRRKLLTSNQTLIFILWIGIDLLAQFISKRSIPEYYFTNFFVVLFLVLSLLINKMKIYKTKIAVIILAIYLSAVTFWFLTQPDELGGYLQKKRTIEYIGVNAKDLDYPCIAINYIEGYKGLPNGYRYLSWFFKLNVITGGNDVPVYSIVTPWTISEKEINSKFGVFGVILPHQTVVDPKVCYDAQRQLLPLWGFTN